MTSKSLLIQSTAYALLDFKDVFYNLDDPEVIVDMFYNVYDLEVIVDT